MSAGRAVQIADHPPEILKGMSSIHLSNFFHSFLRYFRCSKWVLYIIKLFVALWVRHYSAIFWVWIIDLDENVSLASKHRTQSCFYNSVIVTLPLSL